MIPPELFKKIRRIEIRTRGLVQNVFGGEYHSAFRGRGMEFVEVRPYQIGDDIRSIDWNVSARTGETFVKVFEEEREQTVMLVIDVSASEDFGTAQRMKREVAAEISAVLAFSAIQNNDKVGLMLFSDQVELFVPPRKGRRHVLRLIRELFVFEPRSTGTNLDVALQHLARVLKQRAVVILMSDFYDDGFERALRIVGRRHDTVAIELVDPRESTIPNAGMVRFRDAETGEERVVDLRSKRVRATIRRTADAQRKRTDHLFRRTNIDHAVIHTNVDYVDPLVKLFRSHHGARR